ncbi:MAG: CTP synthase, partial [Chloroflexi bacterium]
PHIIIARTDHPVSHEVVEKIALFCDVDQEAVVPLETTDLLYAVPIILEDLGIGDYIVEHLKLEPRTPDLASWRSMVTRMRSAREAEPVRIGIVGKYVELHDAYMSVKEAAFHAASAANRRLEIEWIHSGDLEKGKQWEVMETLDGMIVPGGFGYRGVEGKIMAARFARERKIPYLGICLGMQTMCIEFARNVLGLEDANSSEFNESTPNAIIDLMLEQRSITDMGGTMRLGLYPCDIKEGSVAARVYDVAQVRERHRHRFEFNNDFRAAFEENGMVFSGLSPDGQLVEIAELSDHPYMIGSQFHPEFRSRPNNPHPLFQGLIDAAIAFRESRQQKNKTTQSSGELVE